MSKTHDEQPRGGSAADKTDTPTTAPAPDPDGEAAKFRELALRTAADFDNYRKRAVREKEDAIRYANNGLLADLLPVLDNFELGLAAARSAEGAGAILQGLDMVSRQFREFLVSAGVEEIPAEGAAFDPNLMEAVGHEQDAAAAEGTVLRQTRRGYKLRDRLLRPASVIVSKGPAPSA